MKKTISIIILILSVYSLSASEVIFIKSFYPPKLTSRPTIQYDSQVLSAYTKFTEERNPIHIAIENVYNNLKEIELNGQRLPELERIVINDGIVEIHSKHQYKDEQHIRTNLILCLKLTIGENLKLRETSNNIFKIPEIKGFILRYGAGATYPRSDNPKVSLNYYNVIEPIGQTSVNQSR